MKIDGAKVVMIWSDGRTVELGTLDIEAHVEEETRVTVKIKRFRQKIGWELVRKGFRIMFPWRKWEMQEGR